MQGSAKADGSARYPDQDPSTIKRRPNKMTGSLSEAGGAGDEEDDDDEEDVGEIGTHRKESNQGSQHDFTGANRFNAASNNPKNANSNNNNHSQDNFVEQRMSPVEIRADGHQS